MLVVVVHLFLLFILLLFFILLLLFFIMLLFLICRCSSFTFALRYHSLTLPWTIAGFLHPFYSFNPAHRRVIRDTLIFNHSVIF